MSKSKIEVKTAPIPIGPYSQAISTNNVIYLSGQIPIDYLTNSITGNCIEDQVAKVFSNMNNILEGVGCSLHDIVKLNVFLTDLKNITVVNKQIIQLFKEPYPARTTVQIVALPLNAMVEVDAIAITQA